MSNERAPTPRASNRRTRPCWGQRSLLNAATVLAALAWALQQPAHAQPALNAPGSLLVFPLVVADDDQQTLIQLTNTSNSQVSAQCYYVRFRGGSQSRVGFSAVLPRQTPLAWSVGAGRTYTVTPNFGSPFQVRIPPAPADFRGELVCVETDESGFFLPGNHLVGTATTKTVATSDIAAYTAASWSSPDFLSDFDFNLCLGASADSGSPCFDFRELDACAAGWAVNHHADGVAYAEAPGHVVANRLVVVPCSQDLTTTSTRSVDVDLVLTNELGQTVTASLTIDGFAEIELASLPGFDFASIGTEFARTVVTGAVEPVIVLAAEQAVTSTGATVRSVAFASPQILTGEAAGSIRLPEN